MAISYTYNTAQANCLEVFTASSGGTVFSANITASTAFDYFGDSAVVDDAIYFSKLSHSVQFSDITFNVGTAIVADAITLKWEYYHSTDGWVDVEDLVDDTNGFTTTGSNRVKFPLQWSPNMVSINSLTRGWIRCRISAVTNITEGGANQTTRAKLSDGCITISGGETTPVATFKTVYDWMAANHSHVSLSRSVSGSFDFTKVSMNIAGRLQSFGEVVEFGQNCWANATVGKWTLTYLESGVKKGTRGYDGSTFIMHGGGNSSIASLGADSKIYGCTFKRGVEFEGSIHFPGYFNIVGDVADSFFEVASSGGSFQTNMPNVKINAGFAIQFGMPYQIDNLFYMCSYTSLWLTVPIKTYGLTLQNFDYAFTVSAAQLHYFYAYCSRHTDWINLTYLNPVTALNSYSDSYKPYHRIATDGDLLSVKFYDDSAGTYTDYTTEAADATPDNVPLGGEVGDMIYLNPYHYYAASIYLERTGATNDYEYAWEYYTASGWIAMGSANTHDGTENMSITGYMLGSAMYPAAERMAKITIDGTNGYWSRLRITAKGTGSPTCTKLRRIYLTGAGPWSINQRYSMDFKIVDEAGAAIENATVLCTYSSGATAFSVDSNASGVTATQEVDSKTFRPSGKIADRANKCVEEIEYTTFSLKITKSGYVTVDYVDVSLEEKVDWNIELKTSPKFTLSTEGKISKYLDADNPKNFGVILPLTKVI